MPPPGHKSPVSPSPWPHFISFNGKENTIKYHLRTSVWVSSEDPTRTEDRSTSRVFPGVSLVSINVPRPVVDILEGPHVVREGGLPLNEGVVGEPHAVVILALAPGLQTFDE